MMRSSRNWVGIYLFYQSRGAKSGKRKGERSRKHLSIGIFPVSSPESAIIALDRHKCR